MSETKKIEDLEIALDFDGVLHEFHGWNGPGDDTMNGPLPGAVEAFLLYRRKCRRVVIHSCRGETEEGQQAIRRWMFHALMNHLEDSSEAFDIANSLEITAVKPHVDVYIDDRGFRFTGTFPTPEKLRLHQPHWKPGWTSGTAEDFVGIFPHPDMEVAKRLRAVGAKAVWALRHTTMMPGTSEALSAILDLATKTPMELTEIERDMQAKTVLGEVRESVCWILRNLNLGDQCRDGLNDIVTRIERVILPKKEKK